jgi:hypothetical protein
MLLTPAAVLSRASTPKSAPSGITQVDDFAELVDRPVDVVDLHTALGEKFLDVGVRETEPWVPADRQDNDVWWELGG